MDVQAATASVIIASPAIPQSAPPAPVAAPAPAPAVSAVASSAGSSAGLSGPTIGQTPGLATLPQSADPQTKKTDTVETLASGVAKLYNASEQNVSVSFQVEQNPNEIVTVFTDKQTGKVIVQFPSETMIALAKYFDHLDGSVVNKKV